MRAFARRLSGWWTIVDSVANYLRQVRPLTDIHQIHVINIFNIIKLITGEPAKTS